MDNNTSNGCGLLLLMLLAISAFMGFLAVFTVQDGAEVAPLPTVMIIEESAVEVVATPVFSATTTARPPTQAPTAAAPISVTNTMSPPTQAAAIEPTAAMPYNSTPFVINVLGAGDLNTEAVELLNMGETIDLTGWQITDEDGNVFTFPAYMLYGGGVMRVLTRSGDDSPIALFWDQDTALWSPGETLTLRDQIGTTRAVVIVGN